MSVDENITRGRACNQGVCKRALYSILDEYAGILLHFHKSTDIKKYNCRRYYPKYKEVEQSRNLSFLASNRYEDIGM